MHPEWSEFGAIGAGRGVARVWAEGCSFGLGGSREEHDGVDRLTRRQRTSVLLVRRLVLVAWSGPLSVVLISLQERGAEHELFAGSQLEY